MDITELLATDEAKAAIAEAAKAQASTLAEQQAQELAKQLADEQAAGLKANRDEILAEKRAMAEKLESLKPFEQLLAQMQQDKELEAIKTGQMSLKDYADQRVAAASEGWNKEREQLTAQLSEREQALADREKALADNAVKNQVGSAALAHKYFRKEALQDFLSVTRSNFEIADNGNVVIRDASGNIATVGGKPMSVEDWVQAQVAERPWAFNTPSGSGSGSDAAGGAKSVMTRAEWNKTISSADEKTRKEIFAKKYAGEIKVTD